MLQEEHEAFQYLTEHIPTWQYKLSKIQSVTSTRQARVELQKIREINPFYPENVVVQTAVRSPDLPEIQEEEGNDGHLVAPKKPRSISSSMRAVPQGSCAYRERNAVIVQYNGDAQRILGDTVDDIARAKNFTRKAKMRLRSHASPPKISQNIEDSDSELDDDTVMAQVRLRRRRTTSESEDAVGAVDEKRRVGTMDDIDRRLDQVQDEFASAAYQLLRDGDCRIEMKNAEELLNGVLVVITEALTSPSAVVPVATATKGEDLFVMQPENREVESENKESTPTKQLLEAEKQKDLSYAGQFRLSEDSDEIVLAPIRLTSRLRSR